MQNYTVLDCCFRWWSVLSLKHFAAAAHLTSSTELLHENAIGAVGAGSRAPSWNPFTFSSFPARKAAKDRLFDCSA